MRLIGAPAIAGDEVVAQLDAAMFEGRPCLIWCDGQDVTALIGEGGDTAADLLKVSPRLLGDIA